MGHHNKFDSRSHSTLLSASLQNLQLSTDLKNIPPRDPGATDDDDAINEFHPNLTKENIDSLKATGSSTNAPLLSSSGLSTPYTAISATGIDSPIPDPNGLGWPGASRKNRFFFPSLSGVPAKSTLLRLNATPAEKLEREQRLAGAVRTILECLGEDPDREGLQKTPERYAKALMWMTRGYEERLKGNHPLH